MKRLFIWRFPAEFISGTDMRYEGFIPVGKLPKPQGGRSNVICSYFSISVVTL